MPTKQIISSHENTMEKAVDFLRNEAVDFLRNELKSVRTGRAAPGLVENLVVDYYGSPTPLKSLATIAAPEPASIVIKPFDAGCLKDIEKAIKSSDLSLSPVLEGKMIRLNIPPLSEERRKQIVGQVKQLGEKTKVSIRNIRRDAKMMSKRAKPSPRMIAKKAKSRSTRSPKRTINRSAKSLRSNPKRS
jgi:ribosome recycling factor